MSCNHIRPRSSTAHRRTCVFWNLCLWNPFLHTYDFTHEQVTINGAQVAYEPDGSWRIVISDTDPGRPNWVSTAGRSKGLIWLRWFQRRAPESGRCHVGPRRAGPGDERRGRRFRRPRLLLATRRAIAAVGVTAPLSTGAWLVEREPFAVRNAGIDPGGIQRPYCTTVPRNRY